MNKMWNKKKLDEIYDFSSGLSKPADDFGYGFPFLSFKTIFNNYFLPETLDEFVNSTEEEKEKFSIKKGDVFLTRTSETLNELAMSCVALKEYPNATFNGFTKRLRPKSNIIHPVYAAFYFRSPIFRKYVNSMATMTTRASLNNNILSKLPIFFPSYEDQKKIANILFQLTLKIKNNKKINHNLDLILDNLFKKMFIDKFSENTIPDKWNIKKIGDLPLIITDYVANGSFASLKNNVTILNYEDYAYFIRNTDLKTNSFEKFVDEHSYRFLKKSSLFGNEVLISNVGDVGSIFLCPSLDKPMTLGNNMILVKSEKNNINLNYYIYLLFKSSFGQYLLNSITSGSVQLKFNKTDFKSLKLTFPTYEYIDKFNRIIQPIFKQKNILTVEINKLTVLRDTLLPKLMSGKLNLSKMEI